VIPPGLPATCSSAGRTCCGGAEPARRKRDHRHREVALLPDALAHRLLGYSSTSLDNLVKSASSTGSIAASLAGPLFTFGGIRGQVESAEAAQREALAFYQQVVLNAFRDTNDALIGVQKTREEYDALAGRARALRTYAKLSRSKYEGGATSYIECCTPRTSSSRPS